MMMPSWHHHSPVSPEDYHLHVMLFLLNRDWGVEADPQTKIFSHQCGGHLQPVGTPPPPDKSNPDVDYIRLPV